MDVKTFMNSANIIALFKELSDTDKANVIAMLTAEMPVAKTIPITTNQSAYQKRVEAEYTKCLAHCKELAGNGVTNCYYTFERDLRADVMEMLDKNGIYRMGLSKVEVFGDKAEVRLTWN